MDSYSLNRGKINGMFFMMFILCFSLYGQNYNPLSYHFNGTPDHGIKIRTNIPFQDGVGMPTVILEGFEYQRGNIIDIKLNWYVFHGEFIRSNASSSGSYTPEIKLANDNGKISIYINDRKYFSRFNIRVFAQGRGETPSMFENWVAVDEPISGDNIVSVPYKNKFSPEIVSTASGNVGIGTASPDAKLTVKGKIHAQEVKVDLGGAIAPDYVFEEDYDLPSLKEIREYILRKGHLPEIPSAEEMKEHGINLNEMNLKLLKKIEELTLYTIRQEERIDALEKQNKEITGLLQQLPDQE
ncbi:tail fiber protein [Sinomicrobium kalidii]|uniref:tail fiber protein n=1 Tax=Sinomicrobium kalidii TaxID=2900738 RepID=UPI001E511F43|nr:tail fiber protein [Sinomicrobium kalidii]UGU18164.1 tail fiber protein [Sinomicrobium kalidii]